MNIDEVDIKLKDGKFEYVNSIYHIDNFKKSGIVGEKQLYRYKDGLLIWKDGNNWKIY